MQQPIADFAIHEQSTRIVVEFDQSLPARIDFVIGCRDALHFCARIAFKIADKPDTNS
jgi:hypothetical protein